MCVGTFRLFVVYFKIESQEIHNFSFNQKKKKKRKRKVQIESK